LLEGGWVLDNALVCLVLLALVVVAGVLGRYVKVAAPFLQIAVGGLAGSVLPGLHVEFDPAVFMLLFVPPLLFADGWEMPKREFAKYLRPIFFMAFGLVFFTVWALGYFIHWLVPGLPLAAAFALAAVLSPTDVVALGAITQGRRLPEKAANVLRGEALLNDASGLVSFKFAIAALLTGVFSLKAAALGFVTIGAGGAAVGVAVAWLAARVLAWIEPKGGGETTTEGLLLMLLPFGVYMTAEHLHVSGIMAAVAAGMYMSRSKYFRQTGASMRIESRITWGMLGAVLNGVIFVLLGFYVPVAVRQAETLVAGTHAGLWFITGTALALAVALVVLRGVWILIAVWAWTVYDRLMRRQEAAKPPLWVVVLLSVAGVRGAITLAGVLTVPLMLGEGVVFHERAVMIALAVGVILWSLLIGYMGVPLVLKLAGVPDEDPALEELHEARAAVAEAAIRALELRHASLAGTLDETAANMHVRLVESLKTHYGGIVGLRDMSREDKKKGGAALVLSLELQMVAISGAREELLRLRETEEINDETHDQVSCDLDMREAYLREVLR
jgi:monovalent cation/hydrogen antiporter